jgi:hypothetical protein
MVVVIVMMMIAVASRSRASNLRRASLLTDSEVGLGRGVSRRVLAGVG